MVPLQPFGETPMNMHTAWGRVKMSTTSNILKCPEQCTSRVCLTWQYHKWLWGTFRFCPKPKNHKVAFSQHAGGIQPCLPHPKTDAQKAKKWKLRENKIISKFGGGEKNPIDINYMKTINEMQFSIPISWKECKMVRTGFKSIKADWASAMVTLTAFLFGKSERNPTRARGRTCKLHIARAGILSCTSTLWGRLANQWTMPPLLAEGFKFICKYVWTCRLNTKNLV